MSTSPEAPTPLEPVAPERVIPTRVRLTAEDIAKINKALEAANGNRAMAADILGYTVEKIRFAVQANPSLFARWRLDNETAEGRTHINEITTINRTPPKPLTLTREEKTAIALSVTEKKLNRSLAKLGFGKQEIKAISSVEEFAGKHFEETLSILHGGMVKSSMRLMLLAEKIERNYLQADDLEERDKKFWWDHYFKILEALRSFNDAANRAALTRAMIDIKKKETKGLGKPGFSPTTAIQINVPEGSSIRKEVSVPPPES